MPPETPTVVWILWTVVGVLSAGIVAMAAWIWGRIVKRPEEVHAAARDGDQGLSKRIDEMAEKVQRVLTEMALMNQALGAIRRELRQYRKDFHELQVMVNENRADIAVIGGALAMVQNHLDLTPAPMPRRPKRPVVVASSDSDDDDGEDKNGNGG